jgi:hypothetical protein
LNTLLACAIFHFIESKIRKIHGEEEMKIGDAAPDCILKDQGGRDFKLCKNPGKKGLGGLFEVKEIAYAF